VYTSKSTWRTSSICEDVLIKMPLAGVVRSVVISVAWSNR
jgi:hypothetical protein